MKNLSLFALIYCLAIASRLLPHPPNFTPTIVLGIFFARYLPMRYAIVVTITNMLCSDGLLAWWQGYPWIGSWSIFTYSALLAIVWFASYFRASLIYALIATLFFWIWTNFGVWALSGMYLHSWAGLINCYVFAIPFLYYGIVGTIVWYLVIFMLADQVTRQLFLPNGHGIDS